MNNTIDIMELLKEASLHKGIAQGIEHAVEEIIKQVQAQQGAKGEPEEDEGSTVQKL